MDTIVRCESGYNVAVQSNHVYTETNVPKGYRVGDREQSFGLAQIHLPAHKHVTREEATNPYFAADFLARGIANGQATMWSCYNNYIAKR